MSGPTHDWLCDRAVRWLLGTGGCGVALREPGGARLFEEPDAIGWNSCGWSVMVECKASRSDFFADWHKPSRRNPDMGLGHARYYMTPPNLVQAGEVPEGWGLLWAGKRVRRVVNVHPPNMRRACDLRILHREFPILWKAIRLAIVRNGEGRGLVLPDDVRNPS